MKRIISKYYLVEDTFSYVGADQSGNKLDYGSFEKDDVIAFISGIEISKEYHKCFSSVYSVNRDEEVVHQDNNFFKESPITQFVPTLDDKLVIYAKSSFIRELISKGIEN